jgi:glycosyltransferase involved in cell wall biosynthesis
VVGISNHYLDWGLRHAGRCRSQFDLVATHGYPDPLSAVNGCERVREVPGTGVAHSNRKIFWFAGTFVGSIDLGTVIESARLLAHRPDIQFVLTGSGERVAEWQQQAQGLANVVFTGWARREQLASLAADAYAGLAAYKGGALMSLTNKLFEYLGFGLPVLCSLPGEARVLLESSGAGIFYSPENPGELAMAVESLADSPQRRESMAKIARSLFEREFSSVKVYSRLADHLEFCASAGSPGDRQHST